LKYNIGTTIAVLAMFVLCLILAGCSDDPTGPIIDDIPVETDPVLASQDEALTHFSDVFESRNLDHYRALLSPEFTFIGKAGADFDHDQELSIMTKIFTELEGDDGVIISNIEVSQLDPQGAWAETSDEDEPFGEYSDSWSRRYEVNIIFYLQGENTVFLVNGDAVFYLVNSGTAEEPDFKLLGIKDQTIGDKGIENRSLSGIKELFN